MSRRIEEALLSIAGLMKEHNALFARWVESSERIEQLYALTVARAGRKDQLDDREANLEFDEARMRANQEIVARLMKDWGIKKEEERKEGKHEQPSENV